MNTGGFVETPISQDQLMVTIALGLVAVLAVLVILGMLWGARLKRQRTAAKEAEEARTDQLEAEGVEATNTAEGAPTEAEENPPQAETAPPTAGESAPAVPPSAPVPTAPAPPPLGDQPAVGTPAPQPSLADEPVAAAAPLDASPATAADPTPADAPPASEDGELTQLKGLGPKIAARLNELGIADIGQLAALDDAEAARLDDQLGTFKGRMGRDRWREQAKLLAAGDRAGFEAAFGRL